MTNLFQDTVCEVGLKHYTRDEVQARASEPVDYEFWQQRLDTTPPFIAEIDGVLVGFLTLTDQGHVEWTYTHRDFQRRGIATVNVWRTG